MSAMKLIVALFAVIPLYSVYSTNPSYYVLPPAEDSEPIDPNCYKRWTTEPGFAQWLVHIYDPNGAVDLATGSIISKRHVLTSCFPLFNINLQRVSVLASATAFSSVAPDMRQGIFPWAKKDDGCLPELLRPIGMITPRKCDLKPFLKGPFNYGVIANSFLILVLREQIHHTTENFHFMPFDFDVNRHLRMVRWYRSLRKARCVIPKWKPSNTGVVVQAFEQQGFTYRAMADNQECRGLLCQEFCKPFPEKSNEYPGGVPECLTKCNELPPKDRTKLICIKQMRENVQGEEKYSIPYDGNRVQTEAEEDERCSGIPYTEPYSGKTLVYGAPVVCNGQVIGIVTYCMKRNLVVSLIAPIRHQLFRLSTVGLFNGPLPEGNFIDGSNSTMSSTQPPNRHK